MSDSYLVEIRLGGAIKRGLRNIIQDIADRFNERELVCSHYVPHISLYGPCQVTDEKAALRRIRDVCSEYDAVPFSISGFDHFGEDVIYADVHSSRALRSLRYKLSKELHSITEGEPSHDHNRWCKFHSTVARNISGSFDDIWEYVTAKYSIDYEGYVNRVNLLRNGNISKEYSVPQGRYLDAEAATSSPSWERDETLIKRYEEAGDHDELVRSQPSTPRRWQTLASDRLSGDGTSHRRNTELVNRQQKAFISGDLHLNHENIIEYCDRPFETVQEMNQELIANWNDTVAPDDTVVFLGDLAFYYGNITTYDWLHALNGNIVFIRGNHDGAEGVDYEQDYILDTGRRQFYCTHRPEDIPDDWTGWAIHGHVHNNNLDKHPFVHGGKKRINAAPELMSYSPIAISDIEPAIENSEMVCRTVADLP